MKKFISFVLTALLCVSSFLFTTADALANTALDDVTSDISVQSSVPPSFAAPLNFEVDESSVPPSFAAPLNFEVDDRPRSLVSGDFNGDGRLDLANANNWSANVSVLLGNGDGTFGPATNFAIGTILSPRGLVSGDFNSDGKLDLATANTLSNDVSVLLGDGNGTFVPTINFAIAPGSWSVVSGDFNSDDRLDLATANRDSNNVSVLLGNGNGTFQPADNIEVSSAAFSVVGADVNGDGRLDLATANSARHPNYVSVVLGNDDGTFESPTNFPDGNSSASIVSGDFNSDGRLDLATANWGSDTVSVLINTATFPDPTPDLTPDPTSTLAPTPAHVINAPIYCDDGYKYYMGKCRRKM